MDWRQTGDRPLPEAMMTRFTAHLFCSDLPHNPFTISSLSPFTLLMCSPHPVPTYLITHSPNTYHFFLVSIHPTYVLTSSCSDLPHNPYTISSLSPFTIPSPDSKAPKSGMSCGWLGPRPRKIIQCNDAMTQSSASKMYTSTHNKHPIAHLWGWDMSCLLWVQVMIYSQEIIWEAYAISLRPSDAYKRQ